MYTIYRRRKEDHFSESVSIIILQSGKSDGRRWSNWGHRNVNPVESSRLKCFAVNSEEQAVSLQQLQNDNNISTIIGLTERRNWTPRRN